MSDLGTGITRLSWLPYDIAMRVVLQRVTSASVMVDGAVVSEIGRGIMCLVGICDGDTEADAAWLSTRLLGAKLWENEDGKPWRKSVANLGYDVLLVSQFTLYGTLNKKHVPDYKRAMSPAQARALYETLMVYLARAHRSGAVRGGVFGAIMAVQLVNDGPVTLVVESPTAVTACDAAGATELEDGCAAAADTATGE